MTIHVELEGLDASGTRCMEWRFVALQPPFAHETRRRPNSANTPPPVEPQRQHLKRWQHHIPKESPYHIQYPQDETQNDEIQQ